MIPKNIKHEDIIKAINYIQSNGVPGKRKSTKFSVLYEGRLYPPKYVLALSNIYANGHELPAENFSGGLEANSFLVKLGFQITSEVSTSSFKPIKTSSWEQISKTVALKYSDKSTFLYNGTVIPQRIRAFFCLDIDSMKNDIALKLFWGGNEYQAKATLSNGRTRLFWGKSLSDLLRRLYPGYYESFQNIGGVEGNSPVLRFEKSTQRDSRKFTLEFISQSDIQQDVEGEIAEEEFLMEGASKKFYGNRYERRPENRMKAIQIHGTTCKVCGFNFEAVYGERGRGFIEVHHTRPLYLNKKEQPIDPVTDLFPVCSNCHRMIHRRMDKVLTIEQMQKILM